MIKKNTVLRIARPTDYIELIRNLYKNGLGPVELSRFKDHGGFEGIILRRTNCVYYFEFTAHSGIIATNIPNEDNLIVFYIEDNYEC